MRQSAFFTLRKNQLLPHISRLLSARSAFWIIVGLILGIFILTIWQVQPQRIADIAVHPFKQLVFDEKTAHFRSSYEEWKQVVETRPDYRDGYIMLAWYAHMLGEQKEADNYIRKVLTLDPSYNIPEVFSAETEKQ